MPEPPRAHAPRTTAGGCVVPADRFFHPGHTWVRLLPGGEFEVGLDDFGGRVAGAVERVGLPIAGNRLRSGDVAVAIVGRAARIRLRAPFTGEVSEVNGGLAAEPMLVRRDPYGAGYLYRARPSDPARALQGLIPHEEAMAFATGQEFLLHALVDVALARAGESATLNDGGILSDDLLAGVPPVKAERIREWIFNAPQPGREARER
jgi:glycine cleavage system H lipoate-binding protein